MKATILAALIATALTPLIGHAKESPKAPIEFPQESASIARPLSGGRLSSYADMIEKVTPAVVSIHTAQVIRQMPRGRNDMDEMLRRFWGIPSQPFAEENEQANGSNKPVERKVPLGLGSGTIIHADGYILTNRHVISKQDGSTADEITVTLQDKREFTAKVIGSDPKTDIAVIKIEGEKLPVARIADSNALKVGDIVFAVGNPMGVGMTVTSGIVSALGRTDLGILGNRGGIENFIQTDASINPGNSGGPLVDAEGRVIGVNTAIVSRTGGNIGIGFAVPANMARDTVTALVNTGKVSHGYLGLLGMDVDKPTADALGMPNRKGAIITEVSENSPAAKSGLKDGDVLLTVNGREVESWTALRTMISQLKPGANASVLLLRDGKQERLTVQVGDRESAESALAAGGATPLPGVSLSPVTEALRRRYEIPANITGVLVTQLEDNSPLAGRLAPGCVIVSVNRAPVGTAKEITEKLVAGRANLIRLYYNGGYTSLYIRP